MDGHFERIFIHSGGLHQRDAIFATGQSRCQQIKACVVLLLGTELLHRTVQHAMRPALIEDLLVARAQRLHLQSIPLLRLQRIEMNRHQMPTTTLRLPLLPFIAEEVL